jgi:hypothetical protein
VVSNPLSQFAGNPSEYVVTFVLVNISGANAIAYLPDRLPRDRLPSTYPATDAYTG